MEPQEASLRSQLERPAEVEAVVAQPPMEPVLVEHRQAAELLGEPSLQEVVPALPMERHRVEAQQKRSLPVEQER